MNNNEVYKKTTITGVGIAKSKNPRNRGAM